MFLDCFFFVPFYLSVSFVIHSFHVRKSRQIERITHVSLSFFSSLPNRAQFYLNTEWNGDKHVQKYMYIRHILLSLSITMDSIAIKTIRISHENSFKSVGHSKHNIHVIFFRMFFMHFRSNPMLSVTFVACANSWAFGFICCGIYISMDQ